MFNRCCQRSGRPMCGPGVEDIGPQPNVLNIERTTVQNMNYRTVLWTGEHLQVTLMCIPVGGDIGLEVHPDTDQFIRVEQGVGTARMGCAQDSLTFTTCISAGSAVFVPAGTWHNVINAGNRPLKVYSIYAPPHHPHGAVQRTKCDPDVAET